MDRVIVLITDDETRGEGFPTSSKDESWEYVRKLNDEQNNTVTILVYAICEASGKLFIHSFLRRNYCC